MSVYRRGRASGRDIDLWLGFCALAFGPEGQNARGADFQGVGLRCGVLWRRVSWAGAVTLTA